MSEKRTTVHLENELYLKVKVYCIKNNISFKKFINDAINEKLK